MAHAALFAVRMPKVNVTGNGRQTRVGNSGVHEPLPEVIYLISLIGVFGAGTNDIGTLAGVNFVKRVREAPVKRQDACGMLSTSGRQRTTTCKYCETYVAGEHAERGM